MAYPDAGLVSIPISKRPKPDRVAQLKFVGFNVFFGLSLVFLHLIQVVSCVVWPLESLRWLTERCNTFIKGQFGLLCVYVSQTFAPTEFILTAEEGTNVQGLVSSSGSSVGLRLPIRNVIVSNHQVYLDWLYIWCKAALLYYAQLHDSIIIILKASLKWVPFVGPGMQLFHFIFLARSWDADRKVLHKKLSKLGRRAETNDDPLSLLIFPEGTLLSDDTRPISERYAAKNGITPLKHVLLPRSTGLLFCLRALAQKVPDLKLVDLTVAYPGILADGYGQDHYTLQSVFGFRQRPPALHVHYAELAVSSIPIGELPLNGLEREPTEEEKKIFADWLLTRWQRKDELLAHFYATGSFSGVPHVLDGQFLLPVKVQTYRDLLVLFGTLATGMAIALWVSLWLFWCAIDNKRV